MTEDEMTDIGAKVYRLCLNSAASHGDTDTDLEWIHTGEEVVKQSDYEIALKRILELEEQVQVRGEALLSFKKQYRNSPWIHKQVNDAMGIDEIFHATNIFNGKMRDD